MTTYGRRRTYKINKIDTKMSPSSKFYHEKRAGQITFADYYSDTYGLTIRDKKQPLVEVTLRTEKKQAGNGVIESKDIIGYLIPEFVCLTGMSDEQRANYATMKELAPYTKL